MALEWRVLNEESGIWEPLPYDPRAPQRRTPVGAFLSGLRRGATRRLPMMLGRGMGFLGMEEPEALIEEYIQEREEARPELKISREAATAPWYSPLRAAAQAGEMIAPSAALPMELQAQQQPCLFLA